MKEKKQKTIATSKSPVEHLKWKDGSKQVGNSTLKKGTKDLDNALKTIAKCDTDRAGAVISRLLNRTENESVKDIVSQSIINDLNSIVVRGIKDRIRCVPKLFRS